MSTAPHPTLGRTVPKSELLAALREHRGDIASSARDLQCSRAWIHQEVKDDPSLAAEVKRLRSVQPRELSAALADLKVDEDAVAVRSMTHTESARASTMAVIVEALSAQLGFPKRKIAEELAHHRYQARLADLLPPPPEPVAKRALQASIRHDQRAWLASKPRGTAPAILASVDWSALPAEREPVKNLYHTSYFLPIETYAAVVAHAQKTGLSIGAVVRAALDSAMERDAPVSAAA